MTAPTAAGYASRYGGSATDPKVVEALASAQAWARLALGLEADAALDLRDDQLTAFYGYMGDTLKIPRAAFGYGPAADDAADIQVAIGDIGQRWAPKLTVGTSAIVTFS